MTKPRLLDLFSGAGGAARGYQQAGFHVTGVDLAPQPRYAGDVFIQADAMTFPLEGFDAIHASPPCQAYANVTQWTGEQSSHERLIGPTFQRLRGGAPWVIENVRTLDLARETASAAIVRLCGTMFGLPVRRHRYFAMSLGVGMLSADCRHRPTDYSFDHGGKQTEAQYRAAMEVEWMTVEESRQAIPPAYTAWIGAHLMAALTADAA